MLIKSTWQPRVVAVVYSELCDRLHQPSSSPAWGGLHWQFLLAVTRKEKEDAFSSRTDVRLMLQLES